MDDAGAFDYYTYVDTLAPEGSLHPYTKDPVVGAFYATMAGDSPSMLTVDRVRLLEGIVRGSSGTTFGNPDARLDNIESRLSPAILSGGTGGNNANTGNTTYAPVVGHVAPLTTSSTGFRTVCSRAGTVRKLAIVSTVAPGAGKSWTITIRKNGSNTTLTAQIAGASSNYANDWTNSFTVSANDEIEVMIQPGIAAPAAAKLEWTMDFVTSDVGDGGSVDTLLSRGDA